VVLLLALNRTYQRNGNRKATDAPLNPSLQPEEIFHAFMDKLGQVCDSRPGGFTFTAFTVLQLPEGPQYVFASNRRGPVELETTKAYTYALLKSVGEMADAGDDDQDKIFESTILRDILAFCRDRVRCYLNSFADALNTCIERCDGTDKKCMSPPHLSLREPFRLIVDKHHTSRTSCDRC
jgi:hypothetical protein